MRKHAKAIVLAVITSIVGCSGYFIAQYNPAIDNGATRLSEEVDDFLIELESTAGTPAGAYERHAPAYDELRAEIETLRAVAVAQRGNDLTVHSLDLIAENLTKLETLHTDGISAEELRVVRTLFDSQFRMLVQLENAKKRKEG
ncbi:MAG TPA: hypothetical protein VKB93_19675 [Thermoanaerobaculia bacterium]|nr:hypothetical protein [Thermoanaerobaculia bacterium]